MDVKSSSWLRCFPFVVGASLGAGEIDRSEYCLNGHFLSVQSHVKQGRFGVKIRTYVRSYA